MQSIGIMNGTGWKKLRELLESDTVLVTYNGLEKARKAMSLNVISWFCGFGDILFGICDFLSIL